MGQIESTKYARHKTIPVESRILKLLLNLHDLNCLIF